MIWLPKIAAIDLGDRAVRVALVRTGPTRPRVLALVEAEIIQRDSETKREATVRALKDALQELGGSADVYVSHISGRNGVVRVLSVPFTSVRRIEATIKGDLEPHVPLPIEDLVVDFRPISVSDGKTQVLAVAVRKTCLREHLEILAEAEIDPEVVDLNFASLTSLWLREHSVAADEITVLLHATTDGALLVITQGRRMVFLRGMDLSAEDLRGDGQQYAEQVMTTLRAFAAVSRNTEIDRLVVTGVDLSTDQCAALERKLGLSVSACELGADLIPGEKARTADANSWAAIIGSALNYRTRPRIGFNFRKEEFARYSAAADVRRHAAFSGGFVVLLLLASVGYLKSQVRQKNAEKDAIELKMVQLFEETFGEKVKRRDKVLAQMQAKGGPVQKRQEEYDMYRPFLARTASTLDLLHEIITLIPQSEGLQIKDLSMNKGVITLSGQVSDAANVTLVEEQLNNSELLNVREVQRSSSRETDMIDFTIRCEAATIYVPSR